MVNTLKESIYNTKQYFYQTKLYSRLKNNLDIASTVCGFMLSQEKTAVYD